MARKRKQPAPLTSLTRSDLAWVVGGRLAVSRGPSPEIVNGLKSLTEGVQALGQKKAADEAGQQQMMGQVMQQMMGRRG
jgi:hypothetical protein